nr:MYB transcription factor protein [Rosa persica]
MVRAPFYDKSGLKKGAWSAEEDDKLRTYIQSYGHWNWRQLPKFAGVKHGDYNEEEEALIIKLHEQLGNKYQNQTSSGQVVLLKDHQQSSDDHKYSSSNSDNQLGAHESATHNCNDANSPQLLHPQILESSPVVSCESTFSSSTSSAKYFSSSSSSSSSSPDNHEARGSTVIMNYLGDKDIFMVSSSETMILDQECSAGDFWTKPFLQDNTCIESDTISSSSSYLLSYDEGMDLFYQVMPTPQEGS